MKYSNLVIAIPHNSAGGRSENFYYWQKFLRRTRPDFRTLIRSILQFISRCLTRAETARKRINTKRVAPLILLGETRFLRWWR